MAGKGGLLTGAVVGLLLGGAVAGGVFFMMQSAGTPETTALAPDPERVAAVPAPVAETGAELTDPELEQALELVEGGIVAAQPVMFQSPARRRDGGDGEEEKAEKRKSPAQVMVAGTSESVFGTNHSTPFGQKQFKQEQRHR